MPKSRTRRLEIYGGILRSLQLGDIHGLMRVVTAARTKHQARAQILRSGAGRTVALLERTRSYIERSLCVEAGQVWICPLPLMYLSVDHYREIRRQK